MSEGTSTNDGAAYPDEDDPLGNPEGYGTPTYSNVSSSNSYFRNGGSPNVWALGKRPSLTRRRGSCSLSCKIGARTVTSVAHVWKYVSVR